MPQQRVIAVLGMHRSGTSCLTGGLQAAGLFLGQVHTRNPYNKKGNRENPEIMALHEDLLRANQATWNDPPDSPLQWPAALRQRQRAIIAGYAKQPLWGFKDPRTLLALDGWIAELPGLEMAGIFRHPEAVAASLMARSSRLFSHQSALELWAAYNRRLLRAFRQQPFPLVEFVNDESALASRLVAVSRALALPDPDRCGAFFDAALQQQSPTSDPLDAEIRGLYAELMACERAFLAGDGGMKRLV